MSVAPHIHNPYTFRGTGFGARAQLHTAARARVRMALDRILTTANTGQYLTNPDLESAIIEALLLLQPLATLMEIQQANGHIHEAIVRETIPQGRFEGQLAAPTYTNATYGRRTDYLKIMRIYGRVPNFLRASASAVVGDIVEQEIMAAVEGMANLWEYSALWANTADDYQINGIEQRLIDDATAASNNIIDLDTVIALTDLDNALVAASQQFRGVDEDPKVWIASPQAINFISGLQTKISMSIEPAEMFEGRLRMATYAGIPFLPSSFVRPLATTTSPSLSGKVTAVTSGGSLADGTYYYRLASVTERGEQIAGAYGSATLSGGSGAGSINLTWTADSEALLYKVYRGTANTSEDDYTLVEVIAAKTYDSEGNITGYVTAYTDTGANTPVSTMHPLAAGEETIWLVNLNPQRGAAWLSLVDEAGQPQTELLRLEELARVRDTHDFMLKTYLGMKAHHPRLHAVLRRVRLTS